MISVDLAGACRYQSFQGCMDFQSFQKALSCKLDCSNGFLFCFLFPPINLFKIEYQMCGVLTLLSYCRSSAYQ